ncbi:MAG TPA: DUF4159 domain-containing protein [Vicinamibacterales bacterium]|nr:DUF4159 domain-containing protein [Vicinamibacterales bacterium]
MRRLLVAALVATALAATAFGQDFGFRGFGFRGPFRIYPNTRYDGRFTFVRLRYEHLPGGNWYGGWPAWSHGYPVAEQNLMRIMNEVSYLGPHMEDINELTLDDPELMKYPVAYIIEVGWWDMSDREGEALRNYLAKGGFVIVDDFKVRGGGFGRFGGAGGWDIFEANMKRALPGVRFFPMDASHPIYHAFFEVNDLDIVPQAYVAGKPIFRGVYEDNDPAKRLQMIINYNTDISQFWEWSGTGLRPIDQTNEAYKLGVNYIIYGLTH